MAPLVPPLVLFLAKHPLVDKFDLSSLMVLSSGAAPLGRDLELNVAKRIPSLITVRQGLLPLFALFFSLFFSFWFSFRLLIPLISSVFLNKLIHHALYLVLKSQ